ncbi:MAG: hypothetical protein R6U13_11705, partial [Desulfatiglandaceae bacterium]
MKGLHFLLMVSTRRRPFHDSRGGVLIGAVVAIVVIGALGAGMVSMFGSSSFGRVWANHGQQAYYLAESGFRYAVSEYKHGGLDSLDALGANVEGNVEKNVGGGKFGLDVEYEVHDEATEENNFAENFEILYAFDQVDGDGNPIPIQGTAGENVSVSEGDNLRVRLPTSDGTVRELPEYRGRIIANGIEVYYQRVLTTADDDIVTLKKIGFYHDDTDFYLAPYDDVTYGTLVFPVRIANIASTGTFPGSGIFKANRTINYTWSMGGDTSAGNVIGEGDEQEIFNLPGLEDTPVSLVEDARFHVIPGDKQQEVRIEKNVDGEPGVRVKLSNDVSMAFVNINWWLVDGFDVNDAYQYQGQVLSYDLQIKMRFTDHSSFYSYLGGVTFRVTANDIPDNGNFYGMSFFYAKSGATEYPEWLTTSDSLNGLIADYGYQKVHLVFWKSVGNGIEVIASEDVTDQVKTADDTVDWGTIVLRIVETGVGTSKANSIIGIVYDNTRTLTP